MLQVAGLELQQRDAEPCSHALHLQRCVGHAALDACQCTQSLISRLAEDGFLDPGTSLQLTAYDMKCDVEFNQMVLSNSNNALGLRVRALPRSSAFRAE